MCGRYVERCWWSGCIPLLGGEYSRTAYADLWAWVQTQQGYLIEESAWQAKATANGGNVPFYSKGNGTTTFRVPALKCWVKGAGSISEVGGYLAAGLPNIEGNAVIGYNPTYIASGAFNAREYAWSLEGGRNHVLDNAIFDASLSNPIYGASDTVQPPSIVGLWCVKAYGTIANVGSTDVANIATGLTQAETRINALENSKVDKAGNAWVVETYRNGTEWYRVWSDGWIEQGGVTGELSTNQTATITFLKAFSNTNYIITGGSHSADSETTLGRIGSFAQTKHTTSIVVCNNGWSSSYNGIYVDWYACGQGA